MRILLSPSMVSSNRLIFLMQILMSKIYWCHLGAVDRYCLVIEADIDCCSAVLLSVWPVLLCRPSYHWHSQKSKFRPDKIRFPISKFCTLALFPSFLLFLLFYKQYINHCMCGFIFSTCLGWIRERGDSSNNLHLYRNGKAMFMWRSIKYSKMVAGLVKICID